MTLFVSVIIPTFQRETLFYNCLESLAKQDYPQNKFEAIVVYDGEACPYNQKQLDKRLKKIKNISFSCKKNGGAAKARNFALKKASGSLIMTIDDDCMAEKNWISSYVGFMKRNPNFIAAGGTVKASEPTSYIQSYIAFKRLMFQPVRDVDGNIITIITANACYRKNVLDRVKGFDEEFPCSGGEDLDLSMRLQRLGKLGYSVDSVVFHYHRSSLKSLIKQHLYYGRGVYLACEKNNFEYEKLKFYRPDILGFIRYFFYVLKRVFTVSIPEFRNKKLPINYWGSYALLDVIRKLSFSVGATLEYYNLHDGNYKRTT